jgi:hypothetical protein
VRGGALRKIYKPRPSATAAERAAGKVLPGHRGQRAELTRFSSVRSRENHPRPPVEDLDHLSRRQQAGALSAFLGASRSSKSTGLNAPGGKPWNTPLSDWPGRADDPTSRALATFAISPRYPVFSAS